jgi:hypothetical protein
MESSEQTESRKKYLGLDGLGILSFTIEQIDTFVVNLIPGDNCTINLDRVCVLRTSIDHPNGNDFGGIIRQPIICICCKVGLIPWPKSNGCCESNKTREDKSE